MGTFTRHIYYVSNVFEESEKHHRGIITDSPAANRKVISLCQAVNRVGGNVEIISLGRGRVKGSGKSYPVRTACAGTVPITYVRFLDSPVITHFVTMVSLFFFVMRHTKKNSVYVFYNYYAHYVLALLFCRLTGRRCFLDIEDGCRRDERNFRSLPNRWLLWVHNFCCKAGVLLAATALKDQSHGQRSHICYGIAESSKNIREWSSAPLQVHLGGSLLKDTGVELFLESLRILIATTPGIFNKLNFVVTGFGSHASAVKEAAEGSMRGFLRFYGAVATEEYQTILKHSHIGLCLKMPDSSMGETTFPSKVIELASNGLLLVSTKVSDVPLLFDDSSAILLDSASPHELARTLAWIADHPDKASYIALTGQKKIVARFTEEKVGKDLLQFWLEAS